MHLVRYQLILNIDPNLIFSSFIAYKLKLQNFKLEQEHVRGSEV